MLWEKQWKRLQKLSNMMHNVLFPESMGEENNGYLNSALKNRVCPPALNFSASASAYYSNVEFKSWDWGFLPRPFCFCKLVRFLFVHLLFICCCVLVNTTMCFDWEERFPITGHPVLFTESIFLSFFFFPLQLTEC